MSSSDIASTAIDRLRALLSFGRLSELEKSAFETYRRHEFSFTRGGTAGADPYQTTPEKTFAVNGDHVTVTYVGGGLPVYIRLGPHENPYIRAREGMVIKRTFRTMTVRIGNPRENLTGSLAFGSVEVFTSFGPLLDLPEQQHGISRNFFAEEVTVNGTNSIYELVNDALAAGTQLPTLGRFGGTLIIKNTDVAQTVYLHPGAVYKFTGYYTAGSRGFPIGPGESIVLQLRDVFLGANPDLGWNDPTLYAVAPCRVALLLSGIDVDSGAIEQTIAQDSVLR